LFRTTQQVRRIRGKTNAVMARRDGTGFYNRDSSNAPDNTAATSYRTAEARSLVC
jgi:hypothetical protein